MKSKKWTITMVCLILATLIVFGGVMYWLDPLYRYGHGNSPLTCYTYSEMYTNPGIAKNSEYDAVMVGTSMVQNTDVELCNELWDRDMVRLTYSGGTTYNMKTILDICFESDNDIKTVYWELDEFQLTASATEPRYPLPEYLYRSDRKKDLSYLLNLDIFYHYAVKSVYGTLKGQNVSVESKGITFGGDFSKDAVLNGYARPNISDTKTDFSALKETVDANLKNITELVENNKDTEFAFFFVPFSVLYWDTQLREGRFDALMDAIEYTMLELLKYDNVSIYFYHLEEDIITNLDNYKDYTHYGNWINDKLTQYIANEKNKITADNCTETVDNMRNYIHNFNFDSIFCD